MSPGSKRKSSIAHVHVENETERMHDLMQAIMWVKQELVYNLSYTHSIFPAIVIHRFYTNTFP